MKLPFRNKNKISGRRINEVVDAIDPYSREVPLRRQATVIDPTHVTLLDMRSREPLLGAEGKGVVLTDDLKRVFDDEEEFDASVSKGKYILRSGKDEYVFQVWPDNNSASPKIVNTAARVSEVKFQIPAKPVTDLLKAHKKELGADPIVRVALANDGMFIVNLFAESDDERPVGILEVPAENISKPGTEAITTFQYSFFKNSIPSSGKIWIFMGTDVPLIAGYGEDGISRRRLVAPRLSMEDETEYIRRRN